MPALASLPPTAATPRAPASSRSDSARVRRRYALLKLARRHGEVRVSAPAPASADVLDLLDELNETGRLRYGGRVQTGGGAEFVYLAA